MANDLLSGKIEFIQNDQPALDAGDYQITVTQIVEIPELADQPALFDDAAEFSVRGPRFELSSQDIFAVFPPAGSLGDHDNVLPHIILNRSTLPWERDILSGQVDTFSPAPWLALLVVYEEEFAAGPTGVKVLPPKTLTLGALLKLGTDQEEADKTWYLDNELNEISDPVGQSERSHTIRFPELSREEAQHEDDVVTVIDVRKDFLDAILPRANELELLAHVRIRKDEEMAASADQVRSGPPERAVIIGNRLPKNGGTTAIYLVSLEDRFTNLDSQTTDFNHANAQETDFIRLVVLKSWRFACTSPEYSFRGLLKGLNKVGPSTLRLPQQDGPSRKIEPYLSRGYVPLPHFLRKGDKTLSWYHGPFVTGQSTTRLQAPVRTADQLLRYNPNNGTFDISYASAWQLGRLLALQDKRFSVALFNWKRAQVQREAKQQQFSSYAHISPLSNGYEVDTLQPPQDVEEVFKRLNLLRGVPFNYLVPDERVLPVESIRFFWLDPLWVDCLLDGAYSIGRVIEADERHDSQQEVAKCRYETVTGFLLRSEVVAGWPGLLVTGYGHTENEEAGEWDGQLDLLRMERLSDTVLLCLFAGEAHKVDIYLEPESLHFGFKQAEGIFRKELKAEDGKEIDQKSEGEVEASIQAQPWRAGKNGEISGVINIARLVTEMEEELTRARSELIDMGLDDLAKQIWSRSEEQPELGITSARFALQMIEGEELVSFELIR